MQRIGGEEAPGIARRQRRAVGDDRGVGETRDGVARFHRVEKAERERIRLRAELPRINPLLQHQRALHVVKAARLAAVVPRVQAAFGIEIQLERIAPALRENFIHLRRRMVAPDHARLAIHAGKIRRIHAGARDAARRRAALRAVKPAVRPPCKAVRDRVRVFESEACEPHLGLAEVVAIFARVKKQIRRLHHPQSAVADERGVGHVQPVERDFRLIENTVAIRVLMHRDEVASAVVMRRRGRHAVEARAVVFVAADHLHARRIRILPVLRHPHPPALIEADVRRLRDLRFARDEVHREVVRHRHLRQRVRGRKPRTRHQHLVCGQRRGRGMKARLGEKCRARLLAHRFQFRRISLASAHLPRALQQQLVEITRDNRHHPHAVRRALEPQREDVERLLFQNPLRHLEPPPLTRGQRLRFRDLRSIQPNRHRPANVAETQRDRVAPQILLRPRSHFIRHAHKAPQPHWRGHFGFRRHDRRLPFRRGQGGR